MFFTKNIKRKNIKININQLFDLFKQKITINKIYSQISYNKKN